MTVDDKIKRYIRAHDKYKLSFEEVSSGFTRKFMRKGKAYTYLGMETAILEHLGKTVEKIKEAL